MRLSNDEKASLYEFHLITSKPVMYTANVNEDGFENNPPSRHGEPTGCRRGRGGCADLRGYRIRTDRARTIYSLEQDPNTGILFAGTGGNSVYQLLPDANPQAAMHLPLTTGVVNILLHIPQRM